MSHTPGGHHETLATPAPHVEGEPKKPAPEKKIWRAGVVDVTRVAEAQAWDEANKHMTESKEAREANWFKRTVTRIWKHNLGETFYRRREMLRVKNQILLNKNIYAKEGTHDNGAHVDAMNAICARFASDYKQDMLREEERDTKTIVGNENINNLVKKYADGKISEAGFETEKNKILGALKDLKEDYAKKDKMYADNLLEIAKEIRDRCEHGEKIDEMDVNVELTLGRAREALNSEAQMSSFDKVWDKLKEKKVGRFLGNFIANEGVVSLAGAAVYSVGKFLGIKALRSKVGQFLTFGGTALGLGAVTGFRESLRLERERAQHMRERASGYMPKPDAKEMKRREIMERNRYETRGAKEMISVLSNSLQKIKDGTLDEAQKKRALESLADLDARIRLGDRQHIDLINYSNGKKVEQERTELLNLRVEIKAALSRDNPHFKDDLEHLSTDQITKLLKGEGGIEQKNKIFKKMKREEVTKKVATSVLIGSAATIIGQEIIHTLQLDSEDSVITGAWKHAHAHGANENLHQNATSLETFRRYITGDHPRMPWGTPTEYTIDGNHVQLPQGITLTHNTDGTYNMLRHGAAFQNNLTIKFDANGKVIDPDNALGKLGIFASTSYTLGATQMSPTEYIKAHPSELPRIHRELWYNNDTPKSDGNELRGWWGGAHNTGIDANGNYVFNMSHMTAGGSFHGSESVDATGAIKHHGLEMLFSVSRDTQYNVFKVPIDEHGNAVIVKGSELWKQLFKEENGHAVFLGKYAEVAQQTGTAKDGNAIYRILATHKGDGRTTMNPIGPVPLIQFNIAQETNMDLFPPVSVDPRRPLEKKEDSKHHGHAEHEESTGHGGGHESHVEEHEHVTEPTADTGTATEVVPVEAEDVDEDDEDDEREVLHPDEDLAPEEEEVAPTVPPAESESVRIEKLLRSMPGLHAKLYDDLKNHVGERVFVWGDKNVVATVEELLPNRTVKFKNEETGEEFVQKITPSLVYLISEMETPRVKTRPAGAREVISNEDHAKFIDRNEVSDAIFNAIVRKQKAGKTLSPRELEIAGANAAKINDLLVAERAKEIASTMNSEGFPIMNSSDGVSEFLLKEGKGIVKRKKFADIGLNERVFVATKHNKEKIRQIMTVVEKYQDGEKNMIRFKRPNQVEFFREDQYVKVYSMNEIEKIHDQMDKGTYVAPVPPAPKPTPIKTVTVTTPPPDEEVSKEVVKPVDVVTSESAKLTAFVSENKDVIERISFPDLVATKKGNKNKVFIAGEGFNTEATVVSKTNSEVTFNVGGNLVTRTEKELNKSAEIYPMNSIERLENAQVEILSGVEFGQIALSVVMQQLKLKNENIVGDPVASEEGESFKVDFAFKQPGDTEPVPFSISFRVKGKEIIVDKQTPPIKFNTKTFVTKLTNQLRNGFNILKLEKVGTNLKFTKN